MYSVNLTNSNIQLFFFLHVIGNSIIEEAARLIVKRHKRSRFGELTNKRKKTY